MGLVFEAEQRDPVRRRVALKVLKAGLDTHDFLGRFEAERQALALMEHPNIARIFEAGITSEGRPYYTMEYVAGVPLTQFCDEQRLTTRARIELMIRVCEAVNHAHQKGIIHRDLKPSNVLVALNRDEPVPKVIDFGIAKALTGRLGDHTFVTELGRPIGTPAYMSPEQWQAGQLDLDTRTDIYSLGVMLYELLVGTLPHDSGALARAGPAAPELLRDSAPAAPSTRISTLGPQSATLARWRGTDPQGLVRELRGDLDWITLKALAPERERRYETVHGLALDLGRSLRAEPVLARPPSRVYRMNRFIRRHRIGTATAAIALVLGVSFTILTVLQARRVARERDAATIAAARADGLSEFLQQTLLSPDPIDGMGRGITMLDALDAATRRLETRPISPPEADAAVKSAIGWAYFKLGTYDRARPLLLEALTIRRRLAAVPADLAESELRAAALYDVLAVPDSAAPLYRQAVARLRDLGPQRSRSLAEALIRAGRFLGQREDAAAARAALEEARDIARNRGDSLGVASAESHLGELAYHQERWEEAQGHFARALQIRQLEYGDHPVVSEALANLGAVLEDLGKPDSAEVLYREAIRIAVAGLGEEHDQVSAMLNNLGLLLGRKGRVAEAETLLTRALGIDQRKFGPAHPTVAIDLTNLATVSCRQGNPAIGEAAARRAIRIFERFGSPSGWEKAQVEVILGTCLTRLRRFAEAEGLILSGTRGLEQKLGGSWRVDSARARLGELRQARASAEEARRPPERR